MEVYSISGGQQSEIGIRGPNQVARSMFFLMSLWYNLFFVSLYLHMIFVIFDLCLYHSNFELCGQIPLLCVISFCPSVVRTLKVAFGAHRKNPGKSSHVKILNHSHRVFAREYSQAADMSICSF
jgi:hypothetical protein